MPNEKIKHVDTGHDVERGVTYERRTVATVHWYADQSVMLEVDSSGDPIGFVDDKGRIIGEPFGSLGIPLNRSEINRLIKALRRARDAAYGRDE